VSDTPAIVSVLGAGPWGTSLAGLLGSVGHSVRLWSSSAEKVSRLTETRHVEGIEGDLPAQVMPVSALDAALEPELLFLAVPPSRAAALVDRMSPLLRPEHRLVHAAKGFSTDGRSVSQIVSDGSCVLRVGVLAGPVEPADLWRGEDCAAVVASPFSSLVDEVCTLLSQPRLRIYGSLDLVGVEVGGAMWSPIALAAGMIAGAGLGRSLPAVLLTRAIVEAGRLSVALGGQRVTLSGLGGVGDWMRTLQDRDDEVVRAGMALAVSPGHCEHVEAAARVSTLVALAERLAVEMPIVNAVHDVIGGRPIPEALGSLMLLPTGFEED